MEALARRNVADRNQQLPILGKPQRASRRGSLAQPEALVINTVCYGFDAEFRNTPLACALRQALCDSNYLLSAPNSPIAKPTSNRTARPLDDGSTKGNAYWAIEPAAEENGGETVRIRKMSIDQVEVETRAESLDIPCGRKKQENCPERG